MYNIQYTPASIYYVDERDCPVNVISSYSPYGVKKVTLLITRETSERVNFHILLLFYFSIRFRKAQNSFAYFRWTLSTAATVIVVQDDHRRKWGGAPLPKNTTSSPNISNRFLFIEYCYIFCKNLFL